MNNIVLIGRLTKDPELRYIPSGTAVCTFTLAVDRARKDANGEKKTDFIQIKVWSKLAELCANYLAKGKLASVVGELHVESFDGQDGQKKWITEVVADECRFLSPKDSSGGGSGFSSSNPLGNEITFTDEDIPF